MKLSDLLGEDLIIMDLKSVDKQGVIEKLVDLLYHNGKITDRETYLRSVLDREKLGTTGIGKGIAIPHGKSDAAKEISVVLARSLEGVNFDSLDGKPVSLIFMLTAPKDANGMYLKALAKLSRLLRHKEFRDALLAAKSKREIMSLISEEE
ncbi:MAG: PTS sugar transporter subunit IIA [Candidatus Wallbacteria bacterium]|nr:PTS sugar transporter subunit IIA [Candidatus Wallbacteria bacterium]